MWMYGLLVVVNEWKADDQCSSSLSSFFSAGGKHGLLIGGGGGNLQLLIYTGAVFFIWMRTSRREISCCRRRRLLLLYRVVQLVQYIFCFLCFDVSDSDFGVDVCVMSPVLQITPAAKRRRRRRTITVLLDSTSFLVKVCNGQCWCSTAISENHK